MSTAYIFYGKSGSGKGTQAGLLKTRLESEGKTVLYIETGKLFRDFKDSRTDFMGDHVRSVIDSGGLMPSFFPVYLWAKELIDNYTGVEHIIFDGVGRRMEEGYMVDSALNFLDIQKRFVITIDVSDQWVIDHMGARGDRKDDTQEGMKTRLEWFTKEVSPVIAYFKQNENYTSLTINGDQTIEEVAEEIREAL